MVAHRRAYQATGLWCRNPTDLARSLPTPRPSRSTLTAEQAAELLDTTAADPLHIAWRLALLGLRRGEMTALNWASVDFATGTLSITAARLATGSGSTTRWPVDPP